VEKSGKRIHLNLKVAPEIKAEVERIAKRERRSENNVAEMLLEWALGQLGSEWSTLDLIDASAPINASRISRETKEILFTALKAILEQAPSTVIEETARRLTDTAGKYGGERETERQKPHNEKRSR
jgi:vacuolar-type H+-ATPase subunit E/Vma4